MAAVVAEFFAVIGVALVSGVFRVIGRLVELLMDFRRW